MKLKIFVRFLLIFGASIILIFLFVPRNHTEHKDVMKPTYKFIARYIKTQGMQSYFFKLNYLHPTQNPYNKKHKSKYLALTFDDGPSVTYTRKVLAQLKKRNVKATFFILGSRIKTNESIIKQISKEGHEIGIHSWNHVDYTKINFNQIHLQQQSTRKAIMNITSKKPILMRPPYGAWNKKVQNQLDESIVLWNVDTEDWKIKNKRTFRRHAIRDIDEGDIVLMHDINSMTTGSIGYILDKLIKKGYKFATVSDLIRINTGKDPIKRQVYYRGN